MSHVTLTSPAAGAALAFRLVGGVHFARSAIGWGNAATFSDVDDTDEARLPVRAKNLEEVFGTVSDIEWDGTGDATFMAATKAVALKMLDDKPVEVGTPGIMPDILPPLSAAPYTAGDVLFVAIEVPGAVNVGRLSLLVDLKLIDKDDQGIALDVHLFSESVSLGALNAPATSLSDGAAVAYLGTVPVEASEWRDFGGVRVADVEKRITLKAPSPATSIWLVGVTRGTPTHTVAGLIVRPGILKG